MFLPCLLLLAGSVFANESIVNEIKAIQYFEKAAVLDLNGKILRKIYDFNFTQEEAHSLASAVEQRFSPLHVGGFTFPKVVSFGPGKLAGRDLADDYSLAVIKTKNYVIVLICRKASSQLCHEEAWKFRDQLLAKNY